MTDTLVLRILETMNTTKNTTETVTCELCGRSLDRNLAKSVPVVGYVGSTCYNRVGAVAEVLEQNGLGFLANGPIRVTRNDLDNKIVVIPSNFEARAHRLGLDVSIERVSEDAFLITPTIRAGKRLRRVLSA